VTLVSFVRYSTAALACLATIAATACGSSPASPSTTPAFSQTDVRIGTGADAIAGKSLTVNYTGWLYDASKADLKGLQFETSVGGTPFTFTLGVGQVIGGWDQGVPGMKVGGLRRLIVPSSLAYGGVRNGPIPPYATLIFEIELLDVQ
jgi:FKBP-type peptidyl-prolyl cis-trans isomerase FkpA